MRPISRPVLAVDVTQRDAPADEAPIRRAQAVAAAALAGDLAGVLAQEREA